MTSATPDSNSPDEVPLEDIDRLLAEEDPEFTKGLEEVRAVEVDKNVVIEAAAIDETLVDDESEAVVEHLPIHQRLISKLRHGWIAFRAGLRARAAAGFKNSLVWLKTRPKEYGLFAFAMIVLGIKKAKGPLKAFAEAPRIFQLSLVLLVVVLVGVTWVFRANLKGIWIPHLTEPILATLEDKADFVETFDIADGTESFYGAFPQELHEFLFKKMKVNLKRTNENPLPMGAFEVVVQADSKDTAVELRDREVELHDLLQRLFEEEVVTELDSENGKKILKGRIKKELNGKLTQGWIKDVHFKTFVLKP